MSYIPKIVASNPKNTVMVSASRQGVTFRHPSLKHGVSGLLPATAGAFKSLACHSGSVLG